MTPQVPLTVLHIPHNSTVLPPDIRPTLLPSDKELELEILAMTDHYTAELFDLGGDAQRIVYPVSRLVLDPERYLDDTLEVMAEHGMGVLYTKTSTGKPLRNTPSAELRQALVARFYAPHHKALTAAVDATLLEHRFCLLLDCHSFPSHPLWFELDQSPTRPQICIGTDATHTPSWLVELSCKLFQAQGLSVAVDRPFSGTIVPAKHMGITKSVLSLMIEVNRDLYMDEASGQRRTAFNDVAAQIQHILRNLCVQVAAHTGF